LLITSLTITNNASAQYQTHQNQNGKGSEIKLKEKPHENPGENEYIKDIDDHATFIRDNYRDRI
jgi:hypothetical protein